MSFFYLSIVPEEIDRPEVNIWFSNKFSTALRGARDVTIFLGPTAAMGCSVIVCRRVPTPWRKKVELKIATKDYRALADVDRSCRALAMREGINMSKVRARPASQRLATEELESLNPPRRL